MGLPPARIACVDGSVEARACSSEPSRSPVRIPMISIARCTLRLLICKSSAGTPAMRVACGEHFGVELGRGERAVRHAHRHGFVAGDRVAGEHELHRVPHTDEPRVILKVRRTDDAHDGIRERGVVRDVHEVARGDELGTAGHRITVNLRDHRLGEIPDAEPAVGDVARPVPAAARGVVRPGLVAAASSRSPRRNTHPRRARSSRACPRRHRRLRARRRVQRASRC